MYRRLSKAFYVLTILLFLIVFLYIYSASPEFVTYELSDRGLPLKQFAKETFFYLFIGVFLVVNVLLILPAKMIEMEYTPMLRRVFPRGEGFRDHVLSWFYSFAAVLNISTVILIFYLHSITNQNEISSSEFNFFFYLIPVFIVVWIIGFFYILAKRIRQVKTTASI
ncbi:DNA topoisomerase IV [Lunatibacter salilacus]|uniref:DNA topoisomerase IV n=1 Tax=Lunatibacter salilacus TaxID=2483804 RepID=UPI00131D9BDD|nr:DNA topoisomerase IV [Lunatibacter salilacus]